MPTPEVFSSITAASAPVTPEMIVAGMQHLERRIPGFTQLTVTEKRSMTRAAYLDPEFIRVGIEAISRWEGAPTVIGRTSDELRREEEDVHRWDEAIRAFQAALDGMIAGNLTRKHRLGEAILLAYSLLERIVARSDDEAVRLRPYHEEMKRLYQKFAKVPKRKKKE